MMGSCSHKLLPVCYYSSLDVSSSYVASTVGHNGRLYKKPGPADAHGPVWERWSWGKVCNLGWNHRNVSAHYMYVKVLNVSISTVLVQCSSVASYQKPNVVWVFRMMRLEMLEETPSVHVRKKTTRLILTRYVPANIFEELLLWNEVWNRSQKTTQTVLMVVFHFVFFRFFFSWRRSVTLTVVFLPCPAPPPCTSLPPLTSVCRSTVPPLR